MATQAERRAHTRSIILDSARSHFARAGYTDTSVTDILESAGVSRGAMYHHFSSKEDLFAAVFVQTSAQAIRDAAEHVSPDAAPLDALVDGCLGWLEVVSDPTTSRLLFTDGPIALGWERCRTLEEATSLGVVRAAITAAVRAGEVEVQSIDMAARLINAVLAEAALIQNTAKATERAKVAADVTSLITGLSQR
ncbi:MAG: TetR/AcrR family transcriptional regulator [Acidimicrobiia bacterium]|nr:TetR/AcrR family transcriptional regulator [Acidimicrobiia bacterium]